MLQIIHKPLTVILTCMNHFYGIHISLLMKGTFLVRRLFYGFRWNRINFTILRPSGK